MGEIQTQKDSQLIFQIGPLSRLSPGVQNYEQQLCVVVASTHTQGTENGQHVMCDQQTTLHAKCTQGAETAEHQERRKDSKKEGGMEKPGRKDENLYFLKKSHNSFGETKDKTRPGVTLYLT